MSDLHLHTRCVCARVVAIGLLLQAAGSFAGPARHDGDPRRVEPGRSSTQSPLRADPDNGAGHKRTEKPASRDDTTLVEWTSAVVDALPADEQAAWRAAAAQIKVEGVARIRGGASAAIVSGNLYLPGQTLLIEHEGNSYWFKLIDARRNGVCRWKPAEKSSRTRDFIPIR
jgi:hypothetical protein